MEYGVEDQYHQHDCRVKARIPLFFGTMGIEEFLIWQIDVDRFFDVMEVPKDKQVKMVAIRLKSVAAVWWDRLVAQRRAQRRSPVQTWRRMRQLMTERFLPEDAHCKDVLWKEIETNTSNLSKANTLLPEEKKEALETTVANMDKPDQESVSHPPKKYTEHKNAHLNHLPTSSTDDPSVFKSLQLTKSTSWNTYLSTSLSSSWWSKNTPSYTMDRNTLAETTEMQRKVTTLKLHQEFRHTEEAAIEFQVDQLKLTTDENVQLTKNQTNGTTSKRIKVSTEMAAYDNLGFQESYDKEVELQLLNLQHLQVHLDSSKEDTINRLNTKDENINGGDEQSTMITKIKSAIVEKDAIKLEEEVEIKSMEITKEKPNEVTNIVVQRVSTSTREVEYKIVLTPVLRLGHNVCDRLNLLVLKLALRIEGGGLSKEVQEFFSDVDRAIVEEVPVKPPPERDKVAKDKIWLVFMILRISKTATSLFQEENSGSSSLEVEESDAGA